MNWLRKWLCSKDIHRWHRQGTKRACAYCPATEYLKNRDYFSGITYWERRS